MTHDIPLNRHPLPIRPRAARGRCTRAPWRRGPRPRSGTRRLDVPAPRDRRALGRRRPVAKDAVRLRRHRRHSCGGGGLSSARDRRGWLCSHDGSSRRGEGGCGRGACGDKRGAPTPAGKRTALLRWPGWLVEIVLVLVGMLCAYLGPLGGHAWTAVGGQLLVVEFAAVF